MTCTDTPPGPVTIHDRIVAIIADAHSGKYFSNDFEDGYSRRDEVGFLRGMIGSNPGESWITDELIACVLSHMETHWSRAYLIAHPDSVRDVMVRARVACDEYIKM